MDLRIDAMGDTCPVPVVKAKKALRTIDEGTIEVLVDNETSVKNLGSLAASLKCESTDEQLGPDQYVVRITKTAGAPSEGEGFAQLGEAAPVVAVISSQTMGAGDDELGANLMKAFVFALTQQDELPDAVLLYNGGAFLSCEGSEALDDLKSLADAGVEVLTCGTCLKHYDMEDKLAVGEVTNMYAIVEKQVGACVIRP